MKRTGVAFLAFWLFQFAFADTCSTITSGAMIGRTGFVGDLLYSFARLGLHLSDHRPLGLGSGWLPRHHGQRRALPAVARHELPRFRRLHGGPHHRRLHRSGRRHRSRTAPGPQVQARRRRTHAAARSDHRRSAAVCSCGSAGTDSIRAARSPRWTSKASAASPPTPRWPPARPGLTAMFCGLHVEQEVGRELHRQRLPGRTGRHHLPLLLGQPDRRDSARRHRRRDRGAAASNCSNGCALTIRSARFRCTASAASGERFRWACSLAASTAPPGPFAPDNSAPLKGLFYGGGTQVLVAQVDRQRDRHARHLRGRHGA